MTMDMRSPELRTTVQEPVTSWTQLDGELRMLCRGLGRSQGWTLQAVSTFVRLPGDAEYRQAIGTLCSRLAAEYALDYAVVREGADWRVRFARPEVSVPPARQPIGLRPSIALTLAAFRGRFLNAKC